MAGNHWLIVQKQETSYHSSFMIEKSKIHGLGLFLGASIIWFLKNALPTVNYFPLIIPSEIVAAVLVAAVVLIFGFQWKSIVILIAISVIFDARILAVFIDIGTIKSWRIYLAHFLTIIDIGWICVAIWGIFKSTQPYSEKKGFRIAFFFLLVGVLMLMIWVPHYRYL